MERAGQAGVEDALVQSMVESIASPAWSLDSYPYPWDPSVATSSSYELQPPAHSRLPFGPLSQT